MICISIVNSSIKVGSSLIIIILEETFLVLYLSDGCEWISWESDVSIWTDDCVAGGVSVCRVTGVACVVIKFSDTYSQYLKQSKNKHDTTTQWHYPGPSCSKQATSYPRVLLHPAYAGTTHGDQVFAKDSPTILGFHMTSSKIKQ